MKTQQTNHRVFASILTSLVMIIMAISAINPAEVKGAGGKVGLITNGPVDDNGWNQLAYEGLVKAETDWEITKAVYIATGDPMDFGAAVSACVAAGNGLCIATSGWGFSGPMEAAAVAHPSIKFAILDQDVGDTPPSNLRGILFMRKEAGYLAGALAGKMTTSNTVGAVGGIAIPPVVDFLEGFEHGAQCANNSVKVLEKYTGTFWSPDVGEDVATEMIAAGADVIFGAAGSTGNGAILYAAEHDKWVIGVDTDQYYNVFGGGSVDGADRLLSSAMLRLDNAVYGTIYDFLHPDGTFGGNVYLGINESGVGLAPYHETADDIPLSVKTYIEDVETKIKQEEINVDIPCALTIWHGAASGTMEEKVLLYRIDDALVDHPEWERIIASYHPDPREFISAVQQGWGPDLYWNTNSTLPFLVEAGVILDLDPFVESTDLVHYFQYAKDGMLYNGSLYGIPQASKAVALYYRKSKVPTPPATTTDLLSLVGSGKLLTTSATYHDSYESGSGSYYFYGFWSAFGGQLLNNDALCIADQGGVKDAMQYVENLQSAGAVFNITNNAANEGFKNGTYDMIINGPWQLGDFESALSSDLGVALLPAGPSGNSKPMTEIMGFFVNNQFPDFVSDLLVDIALYLTNQESSQAFTDTALAIPVRDDVTTTDTAISTFAAQAAAGDVWPKTSGLANYWDPFNTSIINILDNSVTPYEGIRQASSNMNEANGFPSLSGNTGLTDVKITYTGGWTQSITGGEYRFYVTPGWTGKITPSKTGYSFLPVSRSITTPVTNSLIGLNFTPSNKPGVFYKTSPANNAVNQPPKITLKWGASTNIVSYEYCLQKGSGSGTTCSTGWKSTGTNRYVTRTGLTAGTWYWQVRAKNAKGATYANNGTWWKFTIPPKPGAFSKLSPVNNALNQPTTLALKWGTSTNAAKYEYCLDTTAGTTCTTSWKSTNLNKFVNLTGLLKGKKYYWMVRAVNAMGTTLSNAGVWWNFTTKP